MDQKPTPIYDLRLERTAAEVVDDVVDEVEGGGGGGGSGSRSGGIVDHFPSKPSRASSSPTPSDSGSEIEEDIPEDC